MECASLVTLRLSAFSVFTSAKLSEGLNQLEKVFNYLKFSAVLGATFLNNSIFIRPIGCPPIEISKNTIGLFGSAAMVII
jgi:hypothetical protein